jgi:Leucine-rich repeat (LRR) protein
MQNNKIATLPNDIGLLSNMWILNMSGNQLGGTLPESIGNLSSMIWLYLNDNNITEIPGSL